MDCQLSTINANKQRIMAIILTGHSMTRVIECTKQQLNESSAYVFHVKKRRRKKKLSLIFVSWNKTYAQKGLLSDFVNCYAIKLNSYFISQPLGRNLVASLELFGAVLTD